MITVPKEVQDKDVWKRMVGSSFDGRMSLNLALRFLYEYTRDNIATDLTSDWRSYEIVIGHTWARINPNYCR